MKNLKQKKIFETIRLIEPNQFGGHDIYASSESGFSSQEKHHIWDWFVENNNAQAIGWDKEKKCLVTMSVKN